MNVLISGASIAGPALAFFLNRHGHQVTLVERASALREGGYAVDIRGPALEVIKRLGLREALRPFETDTLSNAVIDAAGRRCGRMPRGFGVVDENDLEILRGDLVRSLYDATREHVRYRFGDSIATLKQSANSVEVYFESGTRQDYDLVVGADGVHSRTRQLVFGKEPEFLRELGSGMAIFTAPNLLGLRREQLLWNGSRRVASVKSASQDRELKVCLFFPLSLQDFDHRDIETQRRMVQAAYAHEGWEFPRLLEAMWQAEDFYCDVTCQVRMDRYYENRIALLGDAAYCPSPLSGQGTSLALVGACVLAAALETHRDALPNALSAYDSAMRAFVVRNQDLALKIANAFAPHSPFQVWSRNLMMRMLPYMPGSSLMMKWAMRDISLAARAITLPTSASPI